MHSLTHAWNMTGSSSGHRAIQAARDPPGQLGLAVGPAVVVVVVVVVAFVVVDVVVCVVVVVDLVVVVVVVVVGGSACFKAKLENETLDPSILHSPPHPVIPSSQSMSIPLPPQREPE